MTLPMRIILVPMRYALSCISLPCRPYLEQVFPGLITAQCPLTGYPEGFAHTLQDNKRMMLERNVSLWVQIAPFSEDGTVPSPHWLRQNHPSKYCEVFPMQYFLDATAESPHAEGISDFSYEHDETSHLYRMSYTLTGYIALLLPDESPRPQTALTSPCDSSQESCGAEGECVDGRGVRWARREVRVRHLWFYKWEDFSIPDRKHWQVGGQAGCIITWR
jgi:hypothetical protein